MKSNGNEQKRKRESFMPLDASLAVGALPTIKEPRIIGDWVLWLEQRPNEAGRTTALIRPWGDLDSKPYELTPSPNDLRTKVHEYGGAPYATEIDENILFFTWIDSSTNSLWFQSWEGINLEINGKSKFLSAVGEPRKLNSDYKGYLGNGLIDLRRKRWLGISEVNGKDFLVTFSLFKTDQAPNVIYQSDDFLGYVTLNPDSDQLVWIEWRQPDMPWDSNELVWSRLDNPGFLNNKTVIAGTIEIDQEVQPISVFQPHWLETGELVVAEDQSGWWNVMVADTRLLPKSEIVWKRSWVLNAEFALPQWTLGMSTISSSEDEIFGISCAQGVWSLNILSKGGDINVIDLPFDDLTSLHVNKGRAVTIASNSFTESGLLEIDLKTLNFKHKPVRKAILSKSQISLPQPFLFEGFDGDLTHSWYYPPLDSNDDPSPLLVKIHSGPTGMARKGLNLEIQFWTSRGWGVVDVNYSGSSGFGRNYRNRLKNGWGEVDVYDCAAAVRALISSGKASENHIAIEGGSAGGFTALAASATYDIFQVVSCKYPVTNLVAMAKDTHRFEEFYLEYLIGSFKDDYHLYLQRSPLTNIERISSPIIIFQGLKDKVVPSYELDNFVNQLKRSNILYEIHTFPDEGHGFRDSEIKTFVLEKTELFFREALGI